MTRLVSKVQYKNFEAGEFVEVQERSYDDTIELIEKFPWNSQRERIAIALTNPSVTIEGKNQDFLKFALFYNQKYVLHYFDEARGLFTKSFINLKDGYEYIKKYFEQATFDTADFKKEPGWLKHNLKYFVTQDFNYKLTARSIRRFLISSSGLNFFLGIFLLIFLLSNGPAPIDPAVLIIILIMIFVGGGGIHLIFFFNYYKHVKNKILIMSRANDTFYFGNIENPAKYDKTDILKFTTIQKTYSRNQFNGFAIIEIEFRNGTVLKIPNLLIDQLALRQKLFEYPETIVNKFPYLNS